MAVKVTRSRVCDECNEPSTTRWRVTALDTGKTATLDLCDEDSAPLVKMLTLVPVKRRKKRTVTPITEVTARKRTRKKPDAS